MFKFYRKVVLVVSSCFSPLVSADLIEQRPNIILILADDMGYGDIKALNPACVVNTAHLDGLVNDGTAFTDAHSPSAYCTPSRYSLLTGRYTWRTYLKDGFPGLGDIPRDPYPTQDRMTIQRMLSKLNYRTAVAGKWHLVGEPNDFDFDYSFIHDGVFVKSRSYVENGALVDFPDLLFPFLSRPVGSTRQEMLDAGELLTNDDIGWVMPETTQRAINFIEDHQANHSDQPFFLYYTPHAVHTPYNVPPVPYDGINFSTLHSVTNPVDGSSKSSNYFNFLSLLDHCVGKLLTTLDTHNLTNDTIVIFASDNGSLGYAWSDQISPVSQNGPRDSTNNTLYTSTPYKSNADRRGFKTMSLDGGHRIPFVFRWPGQIPAGVTKSTPVCLTDVMMTLADVLHVPFGPEVAEDSFSLTPLLLNGGNNSFTREPVVHHSRFGHLSIRDDNWKLIYADGHGGGGTLNPGGVTVGTVPAFWSANSSELQLYNMASDVGETTDVSSSNPAEVSFLVNRLETFWGDDGIGRSRPNTPLDITQNIDGDQTPDYIEFDDPDLDYLDPTDSPDHDNDQDGLLLSQETALGTNPDLADTDGDGLWDGAEDRDRSGSISGTETDPLDADSDDDGFSDYAELLGGSNPLVATSIPVVSSTSLAPVLSTVVGPEGSLTEPDLDPWIDPSGNPVSDQAFIRETKNQPAVGARWFLKFDLTPVQSLPNVIGGRFRLHQYCRVNTLNSVNSRSNVAIAPVTSSWNDQSGSLPLYDITSIGAPIVVGDLDQNGHELTSSGFFGGVNGTEMNSTVLGWFDGTIVNHGLRVYLENEFVATGIGLSTIDDPATPSEDESAALLVEYLTYFGESGDSNPPLLIDDQDGDQIPDVWEVSRYGERGLLGDGDTDGDGRSDFHEYLTGTNALDPKDRFVLLSLEPVAENQCELTWTSVVGRDYRIQSTETLADGSWTTLPETYSATGPTLSAILTSPANLDLRFFRVFIVE